MALKDLVASKSALTEEAVEALIKDYVRYDVEEKQVTFLPAAAALSGRQKVLVYLVALQGWPIVAEGEETPTSAKPAVIGEQVGVHGGTLRPLLKELKDRHLIGWKEGAYSVRAASLPDIKKELDGTSARAEKAAGPKPGAKRQPTQPAGTDQKAQKRKSSPAKGGNLQKKFNDWIKEGFFQTPRTLAEVQDRFHELGHIVPQSSMPKYLLDAVQANPPRLARKKKDVDGKKVWVYTSPP
jgi:hypothetical protein